MSRTVNLISKRASYLILALAALILTGAHQSIPPSWAFIDSAVETWSHDISERSIIVTASDGEQAAHAVRMAGGHITSDLWLINAVGAVIDETALDQLRSDPNVLSVIENKVVESTSFLYPWNTSDNLFTDISTSLVQDVGADALHSQGITGEGIGVAVIDSGVFYSPFLVATSNAEVSLDFSIQADFAGDGTCQPRAWWQSGYMTQRDGYCLQDRGGTVDDYGHGTHVAGIIGNRYRTRDTDRYLGIAPGANIVSGRALDADGRGTYEDTIEAIQKTVETKDDYNTRIINLSISAHATVPYFVDPLNRAVEAAWNEGIVVVAAAGNEGAQSETITVPGNDPYIITVGGINTQGTADDLTDDILAPWSSTGPTQDGFLKPDVVAPGSGIISFMFNSPAYPQLSAYLATNHPDHSITEDLFRMSGTSMATAVTSGVIALMLEADPDLTPDEVKYRLMASAHTAIADGDFAYSLLQQGAGRIWAPDAVNSNFPEGARANLGLDITQDLAYGHANDEEIAKHFRGPVQRMLSDDGSTYLYYGEASDGTLYGFGAARVADQRWVSLATLDSEELSWSNGTFSTEAGMTWSGGSSYPAGMALWSGGGYGWAGSLDLWSGGGYAWGGGIPTWAGGGYAWGGGIPTWAGGIPTWAGSESWSSGLALWSSGMALWSTSDQASGSSTGATSWVEDDPLPVNSMHVFDLIGSSELIELDTRWKAKVKVKVEDQDGNRVEGARVVFRWLKGNKEGETECTTNDNGVCTVKKKASEKKESVSFEVRNIFHPGYLYDSSSNYAKKGGGDGTHITVERPLLNQILGSSAGSMPTSTDLAPQIYLPLVQSAP